MSKLLHLLSLATLATAVVTASAQDPGYQTQAPAPVERSAPQYSSRQSAPAAPLVIHPAEGITVRSTVAVQTVASTAERVELRVEHGIANVTVHKPAQNTLIQVDLPGGEVSLLKDGLYTFNADTNTVRVLKGEAEGYAIATLETGIPIKEERELIFNGPNPHAGDINRAEARNDLLGGQWSDGDYADDYGYGYGSRRAYPYYSGYYGSPYGYGYPGYGFGPYWGGYPYGGWGYPGIGIGVGFGGYYRGGFGGFRGGYGGGRFHR